MSKLIIDLTVAHDNLEVLEEILQRFLDLHEDLEHEWALPIIGDMRIEESSHE